jgi:hypothetical protein
MVSWMVLPLAAGAEVDVRRNLERADQFGAQAGGLLSRHQLSPFWSADGNSFAYRVNAGTHEHQFFQVDLKTGNKRSAFDHAALAAALKANTGKQADARNLPIDALVPSADPKRVEFRAFGEGWRFDAEKGALEKADVTVPDSPLLSPEDAMRSRGDNGRATSLTVENATGGEIELFWREGGGRGRSYGKVAAGETRTLGTYSGHVWIFEDASGKRLAGVVATETPSLARVTGKVESRAPKERPRDLSPDGAWRAMIRDHNLAIQPANGGDVVFLTNDGSAENYYRGPILWSPDSKKIAAYREKPVESRKVHIVQSSPKDQLQPKLVTLNYPKPGDELAKPRPCLFDVASRRALPVDCSLFDNPWSIENESWAADSSEFRFVYNQRGHQVMRVIGLRADSGSARVILEETSRTFIDYSQKFFYQPIRSGTEFLWASEREGINRLYRHDTASGKELNALTPKGVIVKEVLKVDETNGDVLLGLVGMPGSDPYHLHFARVKLDGTGFTRLTDGDGTHSISWSPDGKHYLDIWSRVDQPPVTEIRRASDGARIAELERADDAELRGKGWSRPERFAAKGRDGKTDIFGIIIKPLNFDPARKYPVVEEIYAGPHDHFVPKSYLPWSGMNAMAEQGFVIVKIDGMGTNWRERAFHDVCWKNLMDGGFPDRIAWIKAAAASRPWMDLTRIGIYGGSAGGQNALAGLLSHGDFYKAGVADCGCHDNRMDKIWWNEAWMGWPVDESYARNSNVTHAAKLTGKLLLFVGEMDNNVDPASTYQVVNALQQAGKIFDFIPMINAGHGSAETPYGKFRRAEFLTRHLLGN